MEVAIFSMLAGLLIGALFGVIPLALMCFLPAWQAHHRGYSFFVWLFVGMLAFNPIFLLIVLASVPHRKRQTLREEFRRDLDAKLAAAGAPAVSLAPRPAADRSLGDQQTILPGASAATDGPPVRERSLGDLHTNAPVAQSLGDQPTRG
jgi:heme exporter protein D